MEQNVPAPKDQAPYIFSFGYTAQVSSSSVDDLKEIANHVTAMNYARVELYSKRGLPLPVRLSNACRRRLMQGSHEAGKQAGKIRRSQHWIGRTRPGNAAFVPPPPEQVADRLRP